MWHRDVAGTELPAGGVVPVLPAAADDERLVAEPALLVAGPADAPGEEVTVDPAAPERCDCAAVTEPEKEHAVSSRAAGSSVRAPRADDVGMAPTLERDGAPMALRAVPVSTPAYRCGHADR